MGDSTQASLFQKFVKFEVEDSVTDIVGVVSILGVTTATCIKTVGGL